MADLFILSKFISLSWYGRKAETSITGLLFSASPSAIFFKIAKSIINAVNCIFPFGWYPHVRNEGIKRRIPRFTYFNARTSVIFVVSYVRIIASLPHRNPALITAWLGAFASVMRKSIASATKASAADTGAISYRLGINISNYSAITFASKNYFSMFSNRIVNNSPC